MQTKSPVEVSESLKTVHCFSCESSQAIVSDVIHVNCEKCGKPIDLSDYSIETLYSRGIQTNGEVFISPRGKYQGPPLRARRLVVQGIVEGTFECDELVLGKVAHLAGKGRAKSVIISAGARLRFLDFSQCVKTSSLRIEGHFEVELLKLKGEVIVGKSGVLVGNVEVSRFQVEKGGNFEGKLSVG